MALHTTLQIYKSAYDLLGHSIDVVKQMPRDFKAVVGERIVDRCLAITTLVGRTNRADLGAARTPYLDSLLEQVQETETLLRISVERRHISRGQYARAVELSQSIGRQAGGWRKASSKSPEVRSSRQPDERDLQPGRAAAP